MDPSVSVQKPLNGSKGIRAKTKLHKKSRETCKRSLNPRENQKSFTLTIPWNSAKLVKILPGIIARPHHTDRRPTVLPEKTVRRVIEENSTVLLQSCLNGNMVGQFYGILHVSTKRHRFVI